MGRGQKINHELETNAESYLNKRNTALHSECSNPSPNHKSLPQSIQPLISPSFNVHNLEFLPKLADFRAFSQLNGLGLCSLAGGDGGRDYGAEAALVAGDGGRGEEKQWSGRVIEYGIVEEREERGSGGKWFEEPESGGGSRHYLFSLCVCVCV